MELYFLYSLFNINIKSCRFVQSSWSDVIVKKLICYFYDTIVLPHDKTNFPKLFMSILQRKWKV